ncbi:hypothetical protein [Rhodopirellula bahusiensis]|uniref:hypothetical protein n=1 Tax=Rhodopirellula bahusiensis TaxID=2014065 RepID=UPI0032658E79
MRLEKLQFSIVNLLGWVGVSAVLIALSRIHFLCVPIACPFVVGPMLAITVNPTRWAVFLGVVSSLCWVLIGLVPYWFLASFLIFAASYLDDDSLTRTVLVVVTIAYFLAVAAIGGYLGGLASRPD